MKRKDTKGRSFTKAFRLISARTLRLRVFALNQWIEGKLRKMVKLSPATVRRFEAYARRKKLPNFSAALEAASALL